MPARADDRPHYPATAKRLRAARREGDVPRSADLTGAVVLVVAAMLLLAYAPVAGRTLVAMMSDAFRAALDGDDPLTVVRNAGAASLWLLARFGGILLAAAVLGALVQVGPLFAPAALVPRFGRLWIRQSVPSVGRRVIVFIKVIVFALALVGLGAWFLRSESHSLAYLARQDPEDVARWLVELTIQVIGPALAILVGLALLDVLIVRIAWRQRLRMTRRELLAELRAEHGDPMLRRERRRRQQANANPNGTPA